MKKILAFTLTEVLVTLGVIGVVAAMTIPTMVNNYQKKVYATQLKKSYSEISQALRRMMRDNNATNLMETGYTSNPEMIKSYFNVVKDCGNTPANGCFASKYSAINGSSLSPYPGKNCFSVASGASYCMDSASISLDVNGTKGPNISGRDLFSISIHRDGKLFALVGSTDPSRRDAEERACKGGAGLHVNTCLFVIIEDGWEMKY